jgi:hypothetical protein
MSRWARRSGFARRSISTIRPSAAGGTDSLRTQPAKRVVVDLRNDEAQVSDLGF